MTKTFWRQISETSIIQARDKIIEEEARLVREAQAAEALRLENERIALLRERARAQMANNTLGLKLPLNGKGNSKSSGYRSKYGNRSQGGNNANNRRGVNNSNNNNSATSITNAGMSTARSGVSSARSGNSRPGSVEPARRKEGGFNVRVAFSEDEAETNYFHDPTDENADTDHMQNSSGINRNREKSYISIHGEILNTDDTNFTSTLSSINLDLADNSVVNPLQIGISNTSMGSGDELQLKQLSDTQTKNAVEADAVSDIDDNNDEMRYGSRKRIPLDFERNERLYDLIRERKEIAFRSSQIAQDRERLLSMQKEDEEQMHIEQRQLRREDIIGRILRQEESPERIKRRRRKKSSQLSASRKLHSASDSCIGNNIDSTNLNPNRLGEEVSEHLSRPTTAQSVERSTQTEVSRLLWHPQRRSQKKIETVLPVDRPESEVEQCIDTIDDDTNPTITKTNPPYVSVKIRKQKSLQLFESRQAKVDAAILTEQAKEKRHELAKAAREIMNKCKKRPIELKPVITPGSGRSSSQASITQPDRETSSETGNSDETSKPNDSDCNSPSKANRNMKCLPSVEIDINQQQLRDLKKVNPVKSRQKHNIMNRNHNNSSTLKAPAELPDIRITNNANKLVEMILHDILSASCQHNNTITPSRTSNVDNIDTVSDKVVVDSDIQSQTQYNFSEFIDSTSVQSLSVQSQHHQRPNKQMSEKAPSVITNTDTNTNNNIRRVLGQKLAVTKKLISGPSSSPYHPNHKTPPARLQSNPTSKPSTTTSTADIAILAAITAFQHSNLQHPLLVENQDTASLKQTESSTGDTIVDQKNVHDSTLEKHLTKKIERISKQAKSPLKKKK